MSREYGSLTNLILSNYGDTKDIEVGDKATKLCWTDRHPFEVVKLKDQKHIVVRELGHKKLDNLFASNNWELFVDEKNPEIELVYRYGNWYEKYLQIIDVKENGEKVYKAGYSKWNIRFGYAEYYYDYEF